MSEVQLVAAAGLTPVRIRSARSVAARAEAARVLAASVTHHRLAGARPRVQAITDELLDELSEAAPIVDLHAAFSLPLVALVTADLLGLPADDRADFRAFTTDLAARTDPDRFDRAGAVLFGYLRDLVTTRRIDSAESLIPQLVTAVRDEHTHATDLLVTGQATIATLLDAGITLLDAARPEWTALRADPTLAAVSTERVLAAHPLDERGLPLARLLLEVVLGTLPRRLPTLRLVAPSDTARPTSLPAVW